MMLSRRLALGGLLAMPAVPAVGSHALGRDFTSAGASLTELERRHERREPAGSQSAAVTTR